MSEPRFATPQPSLTATRLRCGSRDDPHDLAVASSDLPCSSIAGARCAAQAPEAMSRRVRHRRSTEPDGDHPAQADPQLPACRRKPGDYAPGRRHRLDSIWAPVQTSPAPDTYASGMCMSVRRGAAKPRSPAAKLSPVIKRLLRRITPESSEFHCQLSDPRSWMILSGTPVAMARSGSRAGIGGLCRGGGGGEQSLSDIGHGQTK